VPGVVGTVLGGGCTGVGRIADAGEGDVGARDGNPCGAGGATGDTALADDGVATAGVRASMGGVGSVT